MSKILDALDAMIAAFSGQNEPPNGQEKTEQFCDVQTSLAVWPLADAGIGPVRRITSTSHDVECGKSAIYDVANASDDSRVVDSFEQAKGQKGQNDPKGAGILDPALAVWSLDGVQSPGSNEFPNWFVENLGSASGGSIVPEARRAAHLALGRAILEFHRAHGERVPPRRGACGIDESVQPKARRMRLCKGARTTWGADVLGLMPDRRSRRFPCSLTYLTDPVLYPLIRVRVRVTRTI